MNTNKTDVEFRDVEQNLVYEIVIGKFGPLRERFFFENQSIVLAEIVLLSSTWYPLTCEWTGMVKRVKYVLAYF